MYSYSPIWYIPLGFRVKVEQILSGGGEGVEPLSENAASKESTYLVAFQRGQSLAGPSPHVRLSR